MKRIITAVFAISMAFGQFPEPGGGGGLVGPAGPAGTGDVNGASAIPTANALPYIASPGTLGQDALSRFFSATGNRTFGGTADSNYKIDIFSSGSTGTFRVFDQTATTGITRYVIRAGAGQSTNAMTSWQSNAGTEYGSIMSGNFLWNGGAVFTTSVTSYFGIAAFINVTNANQNPLVIRGAASQTSSLLKFQSSALTELASFKSTGDLSFGSARVLCWTASDAEAACNGGFSSNGAADISAGNGTAGNASATFRAATFIGNLTGNVTGNASGSAGTATGNAGSATVLQTARTIAGVSFNGSANIAIPSTGLSDTANLVRNNAGNTFSTGAQIFTGATLRVPNSTTLPVNCTVGDFHMDTDATSGQRIFACEATDAWVLQGGGGGATALSGLTDLQVSRGSDTVVNIAAGSCGYFDGPLVDYSAATATISGSSASSTAYIACDPQTGALTVSHNGATTITCSGCTTITGATDAPAGSVPLGTVPYTSNVWGSVVHKRSLNRREYAVAGDGTSITPDGSGKKTVAVDATVARSTASTTVPGSCSATSQFYVDTNAATGEKLYLCNGSTYEAIGGSGGTPPTVSPYFPYGSVIADVASTDVFTANETRWLWIYLPAMTTTGIRVTSDVGIGSGKGIRWALANPAGTILVKTAVNTTNAGTGGGTYAVSQAAWSAPYTNTAGNYYLGVTTDSTTWQQPRGTNANLYSSLCTEANIGGPPIISGIGTAGTGTGASVDFDAGGMGTLTALPCNFGSATFVSKTHMHMWFY